MRCLQLVAIALAVVLSSCAVPGQAPRTPTGFELYVDNGSLPPEYQHATEISGTVAEDGLDLQYNYRDAEGEFNRSAVLDGATFEEALRLLQGTKVKRLGSDEFAVGGEVVDLTLIYADGTRVDGVPANRRDWQNWLGAVRRDLGAPEPND